MERFVPKNASVIIKPNICVAYHTYEYAATTNPWVVGGLVRLCLEAGAASVRVMDSPFGGTAREAYAVSGIGEQVQAAGGEMVDMPGFKYISTPIPDGKDLRQSEIFEDVLKADVLIDVPIAKHHSLARLTLGMKNLMGILWDMEQLHKIDLHQCIADINTLRKPDLVVVDAIRILTTNGPKGPGKTEDPVEVVASTDIVAVDAYAASYFKNPKTGKPYRPEEVRFVKYGYDHGLGEIDLSKVRVKKVSAS